MMKMNGKTYYIVHLRILVMHSRRLLIGDTTESDDSATLFLYV